MFQLEFGNTDIARFRLDFKINGGNVDRSNVVILESTWSKSALSNRLSVSYFKYDNDTKLAIRIYIKFTALWEVFRIRQLDAQTGDSGFINWKAATFYSGRGEGVNSPVGTAATMIYNLVHTNNAPVGNSTTPVYVDSNGQVQPCTPSSMSVGSATNVNLSKIADSTIGDTIKAGNGSSVLIANAGNAYKWGGYSLSFGTFSIQDNTICIV